MSAHRHIHLGWRRVDLGNRCEQGVLPEVGGLPPGDPIKQVRFGPVIEGCAQHCVLIVTVNDQLNLGMDGASVVCPDVVPVWQMVANRRLSSGAGHK